MKVAILGGTFDPVHNGHVALARSVVDAFDVGCLYFVPAFAPPHKPAKALTSAFHRFAMVALASMADDRFRVSTLEADTLEARYSVDTLERMHQEFPGDSFLFITGTDMYQEIEEWKDYERLFDLASLAVVCRPGFPMRKDLRRFETLDPGSKTILGTPPGVYYLPWVQNDVSSTEVRRVAAAGGDTSRWVPAAVAAYIRTHRLY